MAKATDSSGRGKYINLSYADKAKYHGQGFVYQPTIRTSRSGKRTLFPANTWHLEWSSGTRQPSGRLRYRKITLRCTEQQARDLLDIIVQVPYRTVIEAHAAIEPYIELRKVPGSGAIARHVKEFIPSVPTSYQMQNRARITRDYHRMRLLDALANLCRELENYECAGDGVGVEATALWT
jgi:hypothetical protein